jgi:hypothetical protein
MELIINLNLNFKLRIFQIWATRAPQIGKTKSRSGKGSGSSYSRDFLLWRNSYLRVKEGTLLTWRVQDYSPLDNQGLCHSHLTFSTLTRSELLTRLQTQEQTIQASFLMREECIRCHLSSRSQSKTLKSLIFSMFSSHSTDSLMAKKKEKWMPCPGNNWDPLKLADLNQTS